MISVNTTIRMDMIRVHGVHDEFTVKNEKREPHEVNSTKGLEQIVHEVHDKKNICIYIYKKADFIYYFILSIFI